MTGKSKKINKILPHGDREQQNNVAVSSAPRKLNISQGEDCIPTGPWLLEDHHLLPQKPVAPLTLSTRMNSPQGSIAS